MRLSEEKAKEERSKDNKKVVEEEVEEKEGKESKEGGDASMRIMKRIVMRRVREMRRNRWKGRAQSWRGK
jgi:hypothetical protein